MRHNQSNRGARVLLLLLSLFLSCGSVGFAQGNFTEQLQQQLVGYRQKNLQEKIFVHTDKPAYLAGETVWFKVYVLDGAQHTPLAMSKVAYLDILDQGQVPVLQTKVALQTGKGAGSFVLPTTLASGHFILRGYTNWMKNAGAAFFFQQPITLVNSTQPLGLSPEDPSVTYDVQFFPEGGHLVNGLRSKVAFKVTDKRGKGVSFTGAVVNQRNDTVARFHTHKFGIGSFLFTPEAGQTYRAILQGDNKQVITRTLPAAQVSGLVMAVQEAGPETVNVLLSSSPSGNSQPVYLLVHTRQQAIKAEVAVLDAQGKATFSLNKSTLGEGISHFTVFNTARQPVCERLFFKPPQALLPISAASDKREYATRSQVTLFLDLLPSKGIVDSADLSVAVYRLDSLQMIEQPNFASYLWLSSDLRGTVEAPDYYFGAAGPEVTMAQDNLMLTHGWRRFTWGKVLQSSVPELAYLPEFDGHLLYGRVLSQQTGAPVPFVQTYLASPARRIQVATSRSNQNGTIFFNLKDLYGTRDLILQANSTQDSTLRLEVNTPFSSDSATIFLPVFDLKEQLLPQLQASAIHVQVQNHHQVNVSQPVAAKSLLDSSTFYGKPFRTYFLDNYTRFPTLEDVLREYVAAMTVRKRKDRFHFTVLDAPRKNMLDEDPLVLLDGVPVFDLNRLLTYDPKKVRKIEVVAQKFYHGGQSYGGIISFTTYTHRMEGFEVDPKALLVEYEGLQYPREFYHPVYDTPQQLASRIPDLRSTLYWAPSVKVEGGGKKQLTFYTSDQPGRYRVVVQGISTSGKAGSHSFTFDVKPAS